MLWSQLPKNLEPSRSYRNTAIFTSF